MATDRDAFTRIYDTGAWSQGSGSGSHPDNTRPYRDFLEQFMREKRVKSVVDFGCGDWQSSRLIDWTGISYHGLDVVESVVQENIRFFQRDSVRFTCIRSADESLPTADLLIIKDVLQHWTNDQIKALRPRISQYPYVLITNTREAYAVSGSDATLADSGMNGEIAVGEMRPIDLALPPFDWPVVEVFSHISRRPRVGAEEVKTTVLLSSRH